MSTLVELYAVQADITTGEWIGEPELVGAVELSDWHRQVDTDAAHFDTYEVFPPEAGGRSITRAITVEWIGGGT